MGQVCFRPFSDICAENYILIERHCRLYDKLRYILANFCDKSTLCIPIKIIYDQNFWQTFYSWYTTDNSWVIRTKQTEPSALGMSDSFMEPRRITPGASSLVYQPRCISPGASAPVHHLQPRKISPNALWVKALWESSIEILELLLSFYPCSNISDRYLQP